MSHAKPLHVLKAEAAHNEDILHFSLSGFLPSEQTLAVNKTLRTLSHLSSERDMPYLLHEMQFTVGELVVLMPLLENYPYYTSHEALLANFKYGYNTTERHVEKCREALIEATEAGVWDYEMRPVRNVLSRTRIKLRTFGIEISSILQTGYTLIPYNIGFKRSNADIG
jgi:hypothetical protein